MIQQEILLHLCYTEVENLCYAKLRDVSRADLTAPVILALRSTFLRSNSETA